jgi:tetratricopeptide (TPR) repeat protein
MTRIAIAIAGACAVSMLACGAAVAQRDGERTGTRTGSDAVQSSVLQLNQTREVRRIERLISKGRTDEAVRKARKYVIRLSDGRYDRDPDINNERYYAHNALCVALITVHEYDAAIASCTVAIALRPNRWTAVNNRGTAHYAAYRFREALADYRRALELAPRDENVTATIDHNIELCEQQLTKA